MKKLLHLIIVVAFVFGVLAGSAPPAAQAVSPDIVISQVYGGAGCTTTGCSLYKNDYIELFNRSASSVSVAGWSVQYASATGTSWQVTNLSGTILPGQYFLVQEGGNANGVNSLPTPDITGSINMSASSAKVALVSNQTALTCGGTTPCLPNANIVDFVGYGTTADNYEGAGRAPAPGSNSNAIFRANNGCTDADNNNTDFAAAGAAPRNTASTFHYCTGPTNPSGVGTATPNTLFAGDSTLLTVAITPGANPPSTGLSVTCDLTAIGGLGTQTFYNDGTNGDVTAGDNTFSFQSNVSSSTSAGAKSLPCTITDAEARSGNALIALTVQAPPPLPGNVVISQVYGGGGNSGATFKNDFIELYNRTANTINLTGWSVQYASATGTTWQVTPLSGSIAPGKYYLVQEAAGAGGTLDLPTPDAIGTIAMSATAAKVALVNNSTALTGACPTGSNISDFVGYGSANCFEGGGAAPTLSNTTAALRKANGATDTDNNNADFDIGTPNPRNSLFPFAAVGLATPAAVVPGQTTLLTVAVTPGTNPASTGISVSCNLTPIGGSATQALYDDGSNGDQVAGDNTFSFITTDTSPGTQNLSCTFADAQGRSGTTRITLTLLTVLPIGTINGSVGDTDNGATHTSPYVGQTVIIRGVIYEKTLQAISNSADVYYGFFIQNTATTADTNPNTSDGLFVFMNTTPTMSAPGGTTYTPAVGDEVILLGTVSEYYNMTELTNPTLLAPVVRSGVNLNAELPPVVANPPVSLADANRYWERLQGMRGQVPANSIVLNSRNVFSPADAEIWVARPDSTIALRADPYARRAFRDAHLLDDNYDASNWDGNGYRILIGSLGIKATVGDAQALIAPARAFATVTNAPVGGVNYTFSKYRIEITDQPALSEGVDPAANNPPEVFDRSINYTIVDYNLENLYDYRDNPFSGCDFTGNSGCPKVAPFLSAVTPPYDYVPASDATYQARLTDIANQIITDLHSPDILMVQEVENQDICSVTGSALTCGTTDNADGKPDVLQELALKIAANGGPAYDAAFDRDSSDLRGIAPAFLYRTDRVQLVDPSSDPILGGNPAIVYAGAAVPLDSDVSNPKTLNAVLPAGVTACETSWVFPRAPDIGLFRIGVGSHRDVYVINNHFKSGPDTCVDHRTEQAKYNAAIVAAIQAANPNARIVVGGDLNVYPRPDDIAYGASDQLGSLYDPSLGLTNLWDVLLGQAPESAYSYVYVGMAQTLDQMFVNQPMLTDLKQFRIAHINSDFPADYPDDVARGTSDHDPNVATFMFSVPPAVAAPAVSPEPSTEGSNVTASAAFSDPDGNLDGPFACTVNYGDGSGDLAGVVNGFTCDGPAHAYATFGTYIVTVSVTDQFGATGSNTAKHVVIFNWNGFFQPVDNLPTFNVVKAGSAVPVKFSLGGNKGLNIFAPGYPQSVKIACDMGGTPDDIEETVTAGGSSLSYDPVTGLYNYVWKTDKGWAGTCRQLVVKFVDGTSHRANFRFK